MDGTLLYVNLHGHLFHVERAMLGDAALRLDGVLELLRGEVGQLVESAVAPGAGDVRPWHGRVVRSLLVVAHVHPGDKRPDPRSHVSSWWKGMSSACNGMLMMTALNKERESTGHILHNSPSGGV